jgi:hypothetical protein
MKAITAMLFLSMVCGQNKGETGGQIVLPSPNLMRCATTQMWQDERRGAGTVYPVQVAMDHFDKAGCPQGVVAMYDKTVSVDDLRTALDRRYGKWARADNNTLSVKLWRVEPEKFAIQLATIDDSLKETGTRGEKGMKSVIYLSFSLSK